jgi:hypothetical protein
VSRADRARERAAEHRAGRYATIAALFDARSRSAHWVVPKRTRKVETASGVVELRATAVVQKARRIIVDLDHPFTIVPGTMDGRTRVKHGVACVVAQIVADQPGEVHLELVPATGLLGLPQLCLDEPWARALRATSPLVHRRVVDDGPLTHSELVDVTGRVIARDERRFVPGRSPAGYGWALDSWSIDVIDNPMPDAWLLAVLLATTLFSRGQPTARVSRHGR